MGNMEIENMDKIRLYKMMYNNLAILAPTVVSYKTNNEIVIVDLEGNVLDRGTYKELSILGGFAIHKDSNSDIITISNYSGNKKIEIGKSKNKFNFDLGINSLEIHSFEEIGESFLALGLINGILILNKYCEKVALLKHCRYIKMLKENEIGCWFQYVLYSEYHYNRAYASKISNKIEIYGGFELDDEYSLISTELETFNRGIALNKNNSPSLKYKLARHGNIVGKKSHGDIKKSLKLNGTNYFLSADQIGINSKIGYGLIDNNGNEILNTEYDEITHIGSYNFILESRGYLCIFNTKKNQVIFDWSTVEKASQHETLPITIVQTKDGNFYIIDINDRIFEYNEITKYFNCYRCKEDETYLRIDLPSYIKKYVTTTLIPVTNVGKIAELNKCTWEKI